jgi:DNA-binding MarR family transcriptional regulator
MDAELAASGFGDRGFPDGRVLRMCARNEEITISEIARELGITRQGASKIAANLRERNYVTVSPSITSGREKNVKLTPRALDYLSAHRKAARKVERELRTEFGAETFDSVFVLLSALGGEEQPRLRDYLYRTIRSHTHGDLEE